MNLEDLLRRARVDDEMSLHYLCKELCRQGYQLPRSQLPYTDLADVAEVVEPWRSANHIGDWEYPAEFRFRGTKRGHAVHILPTSVGGWRWRFDTALCAGAHTYEACDTPDPARLCRTCLKALRSSLFSIHEGKSLSYSWAGET